MATDAPGNSDQTPASYGWRVDIPLPTVTVTAPTASSTVASTVTATATAAAGVGIAGVRFTVDGAALGVEDLVAPYTTTWNTRLHAGGTHSVTAIARDSLGNTSSASVQVTVDNSGLAGPGLLAAYAFDEGQGTFASDRSGNGNTGALVGGGWATGKFGAALFLDGVNDRVDLPALGTFYRNGFTFEAWVQKRGSRKDVAVVGSWNGNGPMLWTHHITGRWTLTLGSGEYLDSGRLPAVGQWQHIAATYDGAIARIYVDGLETASRSFSNDNSTSDLWRIGAFNSPPTGSFDGLIDDVRIYQRALPAAELLADVTTSVGPIDHVAPSAPTVLSVDSATATSLELAWNASTDNLRVAGYRVYRDGTLRATVTGTSAGLAGLVCGSSYTVGVEAFDTAGNTSARRSIIAATASCDATAPTVALTSPSGGSTVGGVVVLTAVAADARGVAEVAFSVDGIALGVPDATAPYSGVWDTRAIPTGPHTVRATARDAGGNSASAEIVLSVDNSGAPDPDLVAAYNFDEGSGTTASNATGNGQDATLLGAAWEAGKTGSAVSLDGSDDRVDLPALGTFYNTGFTLEAWVWKSGSRKDVAVLGTWDPSSGGPMIWVDHLNGHYMLTLGTGFANYLDSGVVPTSGGWQHVAATYDGTVARLYVDGVLAASGTCTGSVGTSNTWRIGAYQSPAAGNFDGRIDDVRIYRRAISAAVVLADLAAAVLPERYPPSVESTSPVDSTAGAASSTSVRATFSEPMQAASLDGSSFVLRDSGGNVVSASVQYAAATRTATVDADEPARLRHPVRRDRQGRFDGCGRSRRQRPPIRRELVVYDPVGAVPDPRRRVERESIRRLCGRDPGNGGNRLIRRARCLAALRRHARRCRRRRSR